MKDNPGGVRIVDQDVEAALGGIDLGGEAFDRTRILRRAYGWRGGRRRALAINCWAAAASSLKVTTTRLLSREQACGRRTQAFAACHQRHLSIEHAPCWMTLFNRLQLRAAGPMSA
jgi:L-alanine-DL-glutamate epimerase-like enolase superfamily enzyme